jgi:fibro-slime domain-containing protein
MKNNFDRTKTETSKLGTRSLALLMFFVMLFTAIGSGSVLSALAVTRGGEGADDSIAEPVNVTDDFASSADLYDTEETMLGVKKDLAGTGADADLAATGATYYLLVSQRDEKPSSMTSYVTATTQSFTVTPSTFGLLSNYFTRGTNYYVGISSSSSYKNMWSQGGGSEVGTVSGSIQASKQSYNLTENNVSTTYNFARFNTSAANVTSVTVTTSFSGSTTTYNFAASTTPVSSTTWTVAGSSTDLFGTAWSPTATANDMTKSGSTWTWTKENVSLPAGMIYYKVAKNHAWTTTYPAKNASATVPSTGVYNVTVTYNESNNNVNMTLNPATVSNLTLDSNIENAVVKATYDGTTINEGGTLEDVPQGAAVTITVTPDSGFKCDSVSGTYTSGTVNGTMNGNARSWTIVMPGANTTVSATMATVTMKKIFFNNNYTMYAMVSAFARNSANEKPLGTYPGSTMTKIENSNIWYIEVPEDTDYITFIGDDGANTGEMSIPWNNDYPKYTAPYGANATPDIAHGGTWGNYIWGGSSDLSRGNVYTVTDGTTMHNSNLFTGISATLYDYYTDGEVANGWISGIDSHEYNWTDSGWYWIPNKKLNEALSAYADATNQPKYDVTYPLYFGNLNYSSSATEVSGYYNFVKAANNSVGLSNTSNAVTGLSGKTLADSAIHYYSASDTTNENGAPMAMFNEDFLSGENSQGTALASILRTSSFPVRITSTGGETTYPNKIYVDSGEWTNCQIWAHFSNNGTDKGDVKLSSDGTYYVGDIPSDATTVTFVRLAPTYSGTTVIWSGSYFYNQSNDYSVETSVDSASRLYKFKDWGSGFGAKCNFSKVDVDSSYSSTSDTHTYYEYDSTDGKDNAYITNVSTSNKTAKINYYYDSNTVHSVSNTKGFFPFNRVGMTTDDTPTSDLTLNSDYAQDLGFGMKLEIPFTLEAGGAFSDGTAQTFDFSGDDDLWVFVDNQLVLDLGGAHARTTGSINFADLTVTASNTQKIASATRNGSFDWFDNTNANTVHTMTIYYMERGMFDSNLKFGFSFHAIPNQFKTEKKIRTYDVNSGFYIKNDTTRADTQLSGKDVTWFEKTYQSEQFTVTQSYTDNEKPASSVAYTKDSNTETAARSSTSGTLTPSNKTISYNVANDDIYYFLDQFASGDAFTISESPSANNKYKYTQSVEVFDDANNSKLVEGNGDADTGYSFTFAPTSTVTSSLESLNLRARFTNRMVTHDLTLNKILTNTDDYTTPFTFNVKFDFGDGKGYIAYPIYATVDGVDVQLTAAGDLTVKSGSTVILKGIPEGANIQVTETLATSHVYRYNKAEVEYETLSETPTVDAVNDTSGNNVTKGVQFVMGADNMTVSITNSKTGELEITHYLDPDSTGSGTTNVGVVVADGNGVTKKTFNSIQNGPIILDNTYIDPQKSSWSITVTLTTNMDNFCKFNKFWLNYMETTPTNLGNFAGPDSAEMTQSYSDNRKTYTLTYKFLIGKLFTENNQPVPQRYDKLPFYSKIDKPDFNYELTYTYPAYNKSFGNQSYTVKGYFTDDELTRYMNYTKEELSFNTTEDETLKRTFINSHAPYEDNFQKTMDYSKYSIPDRTWVGSTSTFKLGVTLTQDNNRVYVTFKLPYAFSDATEFKPTVETNGKVYYKTATESVGQVSTYGRDWYSYGERKATETNVSNAKFVTAPLILADANGNDAHYFQYWSVKTVAAYNQESVEYTRCYDPEFNLAIFQDVIVEPIYSNAFPGDMPNPPSTWDDYGRFDPDIMRTLDTKNGITITFLENSRNQYNLGACGNITTTSRMGGGDRIYSDFLISYNNIAGNVTLNELDADTMKAGLIIEAVGEMEKDANEKYITSAEHYRTTYGTEISPATMTKLTNLINGTSQSGFAKSEFDVTSLDNKNRIQYYYSLANKRHTTDTEQYELTDDLTNKKKYFRAYAYIADYSNGTYSNIQISPTPVYFTIYDMATIENGSFIN